MQYEYEDRYVAFLDILGFRNLIARTVGTSPEVTVGEIVRALEVPKNVKLDGIILGRIGDISETDYRLTAFSDSIAISTIASEQGLMNLLIHVRAIVSRMLRLEVLVRGGIARGPLHHQGGNIFGPALIEAYDLENKKAIFPRVIIQSQIVEATYNAEPPVDQVFKQLVISYEDCQMVHSLWAFRIAADSEAGFTGDMLEQVNKISRFLEKEETRLASDQKYQKKREKLEKIRWFRGYFNWAINRSWVDVVCSPFPNLFFGSRGIHNDRE